MDYVQLGEATAEMAAQLLCDGKTPAELPYQTFDSGIAVINTETCYGVDYVQLGEATAEMAAQLLCDGKTPAELPYQTFDSGIAVINTETCAALGLDLETVKEAFAPYCTDLLEVVTAEEFA